MRILSISGSNLASLEDAFEIRLDEEPLRSAGLFAITGDTGAGKSTLLDAMCLALYGECPRLSAAGINDDVPDASGENIKSRDARGILRLGSSAGEARCRFQADDGNVYEAGWTIRRARSRADGRLQNVERVLLRVADGQIIENQIRTVNERVAELLGLTYEEFRRTVLLAQGDFDAFLRADTADRAALLEKVTGTRIYRDISRKIFERDAEVAAGLERLQTRMAEHRLLSDEERQEISGAAERLRVGLVALEAEAETFRDRIRKVDELGRGRQAVEAAEAALRKAEEAIRDASPDLETLRVRDLSEPARADHQMLQDNLAQSGALGKRLEELRAIEAQARRLRDAASIADRDARTLHQEAETEFRRLGPVWSRATGLDAEIRSEAASLLTAMRDRDEACRLRDGALKARQEGENAILLEEGRRDEARAGLDRLPGFDPVSAARARIERLFTDILRDQGLLAQRASEIARLENDERDIASRISPMEEQIEKAERDLRGIDAELDRLGDVVAGLEKDEPQSRLSGLLEARALVQELRGIAFRHRQEQADIRTLEDVLAASGKERDRIRPLADAARDLVPVCEAVEAEILGALSRVELAVTEHAEFLRAQLEPGEACPVCGSTDHPAPDDGPFRSLVEDSRKRLTEAHVRTAAARQDLRNHDRALSEVMVKLQGDEASLVRMKERHEATGRDWELKRKAEGLESIRKLIPEAANPDEVDQLLRRLDVRQSELSAIVRDLTSARAARDQANADRRKSHAGLEALRGSLRLLESRKAGNSSARAIAQERSAQLYGSIDDMVAELAGLLSPISIGAERLQAETAALHPKVIALITGYEKRRELLRTAEDALADLRPRQAGLISTATAAEAEAERAEARARTRKQNHDRLVDERSGLLGGVGTEEHRSRFNAERLRLQKSAETAGAALADASGKLSGATASREAAEAGLVELRSRAEELGRALDLRIRETGLEREQVLAALELTQEHVAGIRIRMQALMERRTAADADLKSRRADLAALVAALGENMDPDMPQQPLVEERERLDGLIRSGREELGQKTSQLQRDDQDRLRLDGLLRDIRKAEGVRDTWRDINTAVGSATGSKFSRIAQAVTLSVLVDLANEHLRMFNPRYRLAAGGSGDLALHVIDLDMADEIRSTRSLSGGERFLISLSLALGLSGLGGRGGLSETLFIDEGFGSLDGETLDTAIDALEVLHGQGRSIGIISHVGALKDRIQTQVRVLPAGPGRSHIEVGLV